jgi:methionyl-tRNA synthetase
VLEAFWPVIPGSAEKALAMLAHPVPSGAWQPKLDALKAATPLSEIETLFPRVTD